MDLARVRNNQRRSRARRKEYLRDVEERLRDFERRGIEASRELQIAARQVADENTLLRSLLRLRGITDLEINEHLQSNGDGLGPDITALDLLSSTSKVPTVDSSNSGREDSIEILTEGHDMFLPPVPMEEQYRSLLKPADSTPHLLSATTRNISAPSDELISLRRIDDYEGPRPSGQTEVCDVVLRQAPVQGGFPDLPGEIDSMPEAGNATSCVIAANIIAAMRSGTTSEEVSAELGCLSGMDCEVDNMVIFGIMDR